MSGESVARKSLSDHHILSLLDEESYTRFLEMTCRRAASGSLISFTFPIENIDPLACLELLSGADSYRYFWGKPNDEFAIAAGNALLTIKARGARRFKDISDQIAAIRDQSLEYAAVSHSHAGIHFLGGFSFFDENDSPNWRSFGSAAFTIPEWQITKEGRLTLLTINLKASLRNNTSHLNGRVRDKLSEILGVLELNSDSNLHLMLHGKAGRLPANNQAFKEWRESVSKAKKLIRQDKFKKIVLARTASVELEDNLQPTHIVNALRRQYPNCYSFLIQQEGSATFLGCSPERLVSIRKNYLLTEALAGSIKRGTTATEDAILEKELMQSAKNADEHSYVIKAIEQRLASLVKKIERGARPVIKKLTNVQHLFTPITGWLKEEVDPLAVLEQLHPTPAVGGYPWKDAAPYIRELENFDRGWYAGPVGWLNSNGGGEFAVAIRSGLIDKNHAHFYAGCGIVADSDAVAEWRETDLKLTPMLSALQYD